MSGAAMAPAERYWVLAHAATRPGADLAEPRVSAGAVLLALRDLGGALLPRPGRRREAPSARRRRGQGARVVPAHGDLRQEPHRGGVGRQALPLPDGWQAEARPG